MKNITKKLMALIFVLAITTVLFVPGVSAAKVGSVIGYAQPTDIVATINGYQLESYNLNGYTYICVEDLRYYGFDVYYDNNTRTLAVNRNYGITQIDPQNTNPAFWNIGSNNTRKNVLYTDIVTYVDNSYVSSSNVGGRTIINFNELSRFGSVNYDNDKREISLTLEDVNYNPIAYAADVLNYSLEYNSDWKILYRAKGDVLMVIGTARSYATSSDINTIKNKIAVEDKVSFSELLYEIRQLNYPISSIYVEYRNSDGKYITSFQIYN